MIFSWVGLIDPIKNHTNKHYTLFFLYRKLLEIVINLNMTGHFYWIASDSWGTKKESINSNDLAAEGAITFSPKSYEIKRKINLFLWSHTGCFFIFKNFVC